MPAALPRPEVDYTNRDYESLRLRLRQLARSVFPDWTDFNAGNVGEILLELFAYVGDVLAYYQDRQARESFWPTVTQRISAIRLARLIAFRLTSAVPATGTVRFTLGAAATAIETIPAGTTLRTTGTSTPLRFRTLAAGTIPVASTFVDVATEQSITFIENFTSTGAPNQELVPSNTPYVDSSATVVANEGPFAEAESFLGATAATLAFVVLVDHTDRAHIRFGNGVNGRIPTGLITVTYRTSSGAAGSVEANRVTSIEAPIAAAGGGSLAVTANNPEPFAGGRDRMTVDQARAQAPASLRALTRSVTKDDFEVNARRVSGVARALMATRNEDPAVAENSGRLQIVATGVRLTSGRFAPAAPSAAILAAVRTEVTVTRPHTLTFTLVVEAATFLDANITARIYLARGAVAATVAAAVRAALADLFAAQLADGSANPDIDFGANLLDVAGTVVAEVPWSTIFNAIRDAVGVRKVDESPSGLLVNGLRTGLTIGARQFPRIGSISIVDVDTGAAL